MATPQIGEDEFDNLELEFYLNAETHSYDRSVLFVGITGQGKSSLCNFLLDEEKFNIGDSISKTSLDPIRQALTNIKSVNYLFVDIPGVCDTHLDLKVVLSELVKSFFFVRKQGISAIAIVINPNERMKPEEYKALENFLNIISSNVWEHVLFVFTHEKQTIRKHIPGKEYINSVLQQENCHFFLKLIPELCSNRFLHVECETLSDDSQYWETKISEFTQLVDCIVTSANGHLKLGMMEEMGQIYQKMYELQKEKEEFIQKLNILLQKTGRTKQEKEKCRKLFVQIDENDKEIAVAPQKMKSAFAVVGTGAATCNLI